jgi:hypothetical protein
LGFWQDWGSDPARYWWTRCAGSRTLNLPKEKVTTQQTFSSKFRVLSCALQPLRTICRFWVL